MQCTRWAVQQHVHWTEQTAWETFNRQHRVAPGKAKQPQQHANIAGQPTVTSAAHTRDALDSLSQRHLLVRQRSAGGAAQAGREDTEACVRGCIDNAHKRGQRQQAAAALTPYAARRGCPAAPLPPGHSTLGARIAVQQQTHLYTASGLSCSARTTASMHSGSISGSSPCRRLTERSAAMFLDCSQ